MELNEKVEALEREVEILKKKSEKKSEPKKEKPKFKKRGGKSSSSKIKGVGKRES